MAKKKITLPEVDTTKAKLLNEGVEPKKQKKLKGGHTITNDKDTLHTPKQVINPALQNQNGEKKSSDTIINEKSNEDNFDIIESKINPPTDDKSHQSSPQQNIKSPIKKDPVSKKESNIHKDKKNSLYYSIKISGYKYTVYTLEPPSFKDGSLSIFNGFAKGSISENIMGKVTLKASFRKEIPGLNGGEFRIIISHSDSITIGVSNYEKWMGHDEKTVMNKFNRVVLEKYRELNGGIGNSDINDDNRKNREGLLPL